MVEQSCSFASPRELVCFESAHVNFGRGNKMRLAVEPPCAAAGVLTTGRAADSRRTCTCRLR